MEEYVPAIGEFEWISPTYPAIEKIKDSYRIFKFINKIPNESRPKIIFGQDISKYINIPDSAIFYISETEDTPLKKLYTATEFSQSVGQYTFVFDEESVKPAGILISFIIISAGEFNAFSFIEPSYLPEVYKFIDLYMPDYEKYLTSTVNRLMNAVLHGTEQYVMSYDAADVLFKLYPHIHESKYPNINKTIGYAIYKLPHLAKIAFKSIETFAEIFKLPYADKSELIKICHNNVDWSDVYATILIIYNTDDEQILILQNMRL